MKLLTSHYAEAAYALLVAGAAMSPWPWLALIVAGAYFAVQAFIIDRRSNPGASE